MMLVGGVRALFLQALHPRAMAAVSSHSRFREDPWRRLLRTAEYIGVTSYGTKAEVDDAVVRVRSIHARVPGAGDADLALWIHCCEVDSFVTVARRAGLALSRPDADRYVAEQVVSAGFVGVSPSVVPRDLAGLAAYFADMRPTLKLTPGAREAARYLLAPPMPTWVRLLTPARPAWAANAALAFALLPRWARRLYRMPGIVTTDLAASAAARAMRVSLLALPESVRLGPQVRAARARLAS